MTRAHTPWRGRVVALLCALPLCIGAAARDSAATPATAPTVAPAKALVPAVAPTKAPVPAATAQGALVGGSPGAPQTAKPIAAPVPEAATTWPDWLRYQRERDGKEHLDTAIATYRRGRVTVELVAALHVGDRAYYQGLQRQFARYDRLLYELIQEPGAEKLAPGEGGSGLSSAQRWIKDTLQLTFQLDHVDYRRRNFVHADADPERVLQGLRANAGGMMGQLLRWSATDLVRLRYRDGSLRSPTMGLLIALAAKDRPRALKRLLARELAELDPDQATFGGTTGIGAALIMERNAIAMQVLQTVLARKVRKVGVFYGAGHMVDFDQRLRALGFVPTGRRWLKAWDLGER